jgi:hypothetical protein
MVKLRYHKHNFAKNILKEEAWRFLFLTSLSSATHA